MLFIYPWRVYGIIHRGSRGFTMEGGKDSSNGRRIMELFMEGGGYTLKGLSGIINLHDTN